MTLETILINLGGGAAVGSVWAVKYFFSSRNGNGKLTKEYHNELCQPVKDRLASGEHQFEMLNKKIDENHKETVEYILELTEKVGAK